MARPGIMVYFDMMGPLKVLPDADKGRLFWAMLEYGKSGTVPEFDGLLALAWEFVKPNIDRDSESYNRTVLKRQYASFCRDQKRKGEPEITFEEWLVASDNGTHQVVSSDTKWYPTTTSTATPSTTTKTTPISTAAAAATGTTTELEEDAAATAERAGVSFVGGELGKGVVLLSDEQIESLLDRIGIDAFDYYVDKLSSFILKNDAKVKNHYETILKWWQEDSAVPGQRKHTGTVPKGASGNLGSAELEAIQRVLQDG